MSEAPWTRHAPASWSRTYLGHLVDVISGATPSKDEPSFWDGDIPWVSPKDMKVFRIVDSEDHVSASATRWTALRWVPAGSVLMVTRGMILAHTVPIAITTRSVTINQDMKALLPRSDVDGEYLAWLLVGLGEALLARVEEAGHGTKALRTEQWKRLPVVVPSLSDQRRIAKTLKTRTEAIDSLLVQKECLLDLLREQRQALITEAVSGGLRPRRTSKSTRHFSLKSIPQDWDLLPLRRVVRRFIDYRGRTPTKTSEGVPLITAGAVRDGKLDHSRAPEYISLDDYPTVMARGIPNVGDLIFTTEAPMGEVALIADREVAFAQRIIVFQPTPSKILGEFLWLYYLSGPGKAEIASRGSGSTAEGIRADRLRASAVLLPPIEEQADIVATVRERLDTEESLVPLLRQQLKRLREYRQALITAAVTGQLDVTKDAA